MAASIDFSGWFQARFATDPDIFNHPRGANGWTFAFAGEPDFDRVIRFANPVAPRIRGPQVGVSVTNVAVDGAAVPVHPLAGAQVELQGGPKFEGHNGQIARPGHEPVFPLNVTVAAGGVTVQIQEWLAAADLRNPPPPVSAPRYGQGLGPPLTDPELQTLIGTTDLDAFRAARKQALQNELAQTIDPAARTNLQQRIGEMDNTDLPRDALAFRVRYGFPVPTNARSITDPGGTLGANPLGQPWRMEWWMGCWDADAMCGFINGSLKIG
jgi:hypothetical protein